MTQPVSSGARHPYGNVSCTDPSGADSEPSTCDETSTVPCAVERAHRVAQAHGLDFCRRANTVVEGFLCDEPVVVSDACRKPTNAFDELICDDPKMQRLEWAILRETWSLVKAIALGFFRGRP